MAFSTGFGLPCMCFIMLLFLPAQGQHQCTMSKPPNMGLVIDCCTATSRYHIKEPIAACYEQKKDRTDCKIPAYIFITKTNKAFCVNPDAGWLPKRLEKLKENGIICKPFAKSLRQPK